MIFEHEDEDDNNSLPDDMGGYDLAVDHMSNETEDGYLLPAALTEAHKTETC